MSEMDSKNEYSQTEAAISDHRFEIPLGGEDDQFAEIELADGDVDFVALREQAENSAALRAKQIQNTEGLKIFQKMPEAVKQELLARQIISLLSLSRYRRGPVAFIEKARTEFMQKILDAIKEKNPVELILSFFGSKVCNPLKTFAQKGSEIDIAECASLLRFHEIAHAIGRLYEEGAVFRIACDGRKYSDSIGFSEEEGLEYQKNIKALAQFLGILGHTVELFDERAYYPADYEQKRTEEIERQKQAYQAGDSKVISDIGKIQASMALCISFKDTCLSKRQLSLVFSAKSDEELKLLDPEAYDARMYVKETAVQNSIRYIGTYDTVKKAGVIENIAPQAIRVTVHPKPGQFGIYSMNQHNILFASHAQGIEKNGNKEAKLDDLRIAYRADIERKAAIDRNVTGIVLSQKKYPFIKSGTHPFTLIKKS